MVPNYDGIAEASNAARDWISINKASLESVHAEALDALTRTGVSAVDMIIYFADRVYANPSDFPAEAKNIAAGCALFAEQWGFHGFNLESRGSKIAAILDGRTVRSTAPVAREDFVRQVETPAPAPTE